MLPEFNTIEELEAAIQSLIEKTERSGFTFTISHVPLEPLAAGNNKMVYDARIKRRGKHDIRAD